MIKSPNDKRPKLTGITADIASIGRTFDNPHRNLRTTWQQLGSEGRSVSTLLITRKNQEAQKKS